VEREAFVRCWPALALAVAAAFALAAFLHPGPFAGEVGIVRQLQRLPEPVPGLAEFVRQTTGTTAAVMAGAPLAAWLAWRHRLAGALAIAVALLTMYAVQPGLKDIVDRPRPANADVEVRAAWTSESFPSGHSLSTTTVWGFASALSWTVRRRLLSAVLALPIALTFLSSGIQGVHWPSDAVAGTLFGALAAWAMLRLLAWERRLHWGRRIQP
jgi:membrane-associated phospholipid phosphatase